MKEKLKIVKEHKVEGVPLYELLNKYYYHISNIKYLCRLYEIHGERLKGAVLHSDRGYQYQIKEYQNELKENNLIQSMSRKGNCLDNSPTENFFGRLKEEMYYGKKTHISH